MMSRSALSAVIAVAVLLAGCAGKQRHDASGDATVNAPDSIQACKPAPLTALPDTAFRSAAEIKWSVTVFDSVTPGRIDRLDDMYTDTPGAFTFRRGALRDADFNGHVSGDPDSIIVDWQFTTASDTRQTKFGVWAGGSGWTGQPLYVEWPDSCMKRFRASGVMRPDASAREIMVGSLASRVYFIDFESGKESRMPIATGNPIKGTISLDPTLNGNLYVGQGVPAERPFGAMVIDLYRHKMTQMTDVDPSAWRGWGAYDSSPVRVGRFLIRPGENGTIYKYTVEPGSLRLHSTLRYRVDGAAPGMESSMSVYRNYGYISDNHGNLLCVNLDTMRPVWLYRLGDDTDATPVITIENDKPYIYTGNEVDRIKRGDARFVKIDALSGSERWSSAIKARQDTVNGKHFDGGYYATALPGRGDCAHLIFSNCVINSDCQNGDFVAFNRNDGSIAYRVPLAHYAWSSPVGFLNEHDKQFVVTADTYGNIYLIEGKSGKVISRIHVGSNFESSPVVAGNSLVVGSRGDKIYKLSIR